MNFPMASIACFICTFVVGVFLGYSYKTGSITVNGRVYDPANGIDGEVRTIAVRDGRIVPEADLPDGARTIDARGMLVLPGGVDLHSHIAGPKVNAARKLRPEDHRAAEPVRRTATTRSGVMGANPSTFATGYTYTRLGYTTAFDAAVTPLAARHAHEEAGTLGERGDPAQQDMFERRHQQRLRSRDERRRTGRDSEGHAADDPAEVDTLAEDADHGLAHRVADPQPAPPPPEQQEQHGERRGRHDVAPRQQR